MKSWIITGGIGSGKSRVMDLLRSQCGESVAVFSSDAVVHHLLKDPGIMAQIQYEFGRSAFLEVQEGLMVHRAWLREQIFESDARRRSLENILHPAVLDKLERERASALARGCNLFLAEVPLHYEIQSCISADSVIVVASSPAIQLRRLMESRGLDETIIQKMLSAQWPIEAKVERADVVIWNDGCMAALEAQTLSLARQLSQE